MGKHYHLLLETPEANLVGGMKWLQGAYTQRDNARHCVWGHLFPGRYRAVLVGVDAAPYFQTISTDIHLTVTRWWIAEHLAMGYESRVIQAVSWVESKRAGPLLKMKLILGVGGADSSTYDRIL